MWEKQNIIRWFIFSGYGRIVLAIVSFYYMPTNYVVSCWCYFISSLLDAFDGHAARYFNQSKFTVCLTDS
jgi:CDP-diacylglycerol--inositol 3-phosphatidyltransferase